MLGDTRRILDDLVSFQIFRVPVLRIAPHKAVGIFVDVARDQFHRRFVGRHIGDESAGKIQVLGRVGQVGVDDPGFHHADLVDVGREILGGMHRNVLDVVDGRSPPRALKLGAFVAFVDILVDFPAHVGHVRQTHVGALPVQFPAAQFNLGRVRFLQKLVHDAFLVDGFQVEKPVGLSTAGVPVAHRDDGPALLDPIQRRFHDLVKFLVAWVFGHHLGTIRRGATLVRRRQDGVKGAKHFWVRVFNQRTIAVVVAIDGPVAVELGKFLELV